MARMYGRREWEEPQSAKRHQGATPMTFKLLVNQSLGDMLMRCAQQIESAAGGSLNVTPPGDHFPGQNLQVATIQSTENGDMGRTIRLIIKLVQENGECLSEHAGELRFKVLLPSKSVSALIGVRGASIQELQKKTGCHIHVDGVALGFGAGGDRAVNVNGSAQSLGDAMDRAIECVQEFKDASWFGKWARRTNEERAASQEAPPLAIRQQEQDFSGESVDGQNAAAMGAMGGMMPMLPMASPMMGNMGGMTMGNMGALPGMPLPTMGGQMPSMPIPSMPMPAMGGQLPSMASPMPMGNMGGNIGGSMSGNMPGSIPGNIPGHLPGGLPGNMPVNLPSNLPPPPPSIPGSIAAPIACGNAVPNMGGGAAASIGGKNSCGKGVGGRSSVGDLPAGAQTIMQAIDDLPPEAAEDPRGFLLRCALPGGIAGRLGGNDGSSIRQVEASTGVQISLPGNAGDATRMLNIEGPLLRVCAAYVLMMKRYIDCEQEVRLGMA